MLLGHTKDFWIAFALIMIALIIVSGYTSINAVVKAEMFPAHVRALGVGFPYGVAVSLFGGTAEPLALVFKNYNHQEWFYWYVAVCVLISLLVYINMKIPGSIRKWRTKQPPLNLPRQGRLFRIY
jgi:MHS family alpha-ketoglutarate permease-like MFS transporter